MVWEIPQYDVTLNESGHSKELPQIGKYMMSCVNFGRI